MTRTRRTFFGPYFALLDPPSLYSTDLASLRIAVDSFSQASANTLMKLSSCFHRPNDELACRIGTCCTSRVSYPAHSMYLDNRTTDMRTRDQKKPHPRTWRYPQDFPPSILSATMVPDRFLDSHRQLGRGVILSVFFSSIAAMSATVVLEHFFNSHRHRHTITTAKQNPTGVKQITVQEKESSLIARHFANAQPCRDSLSKACTKLRFENQYKHPSVQPLVRLLRDRS